jgi:uncharacterized membrane protein YbhN (UPF0104 family)
MLALIAAGVPKETALAFMFLYHLTQVLPGFIGGICILFIEGETLFGKRPTLLGATALDADPG